MNQEAFQLTALSAAELADYLRNTKGTSSPGERYARLFALNPAEFDVYLATYRQSQSDGAPRRVIQKNNDGSGKP